MVYTMLATQSLLSLTKNPLTSPRYSLLLTIGITISSLSYPIISKAEEANDSIELDTLQVEGKTLTDATEGTGSYKASRSTTALKLPLSQKEIPQSVTIITQQQIQDQNLTTLGKVLEQTPGINKTQYGVPGACTTCNDFIARGFTIRNYQLDGINISTPMSGGISEADTAAYDRIEIVKGATGLLSGAGYPSATINLVRKKPTSEPLLKLTSSVGSWSTIRNELDVSSALNQAGTIKARSVITQEKGNSWMDRVHTHRTSFYGIVDFSLTPSTTVDLGINYSTLKTNNGGVHAFRKYDTKTGDKTHFSRSANASANWAYSLMERTTLFADLKHYFQNDWQFTLAVNNNYLNADRVYGVLGHREISLVNGNGMLTYGRDQNTPTDYGLDTSLSGPFYLFNRKHELILGSNAYHSKRNDRVFSGSSLRNINIIGWQGNYPKPPINYSGIRNKEREQQVGYYLATRLKPTDKLSIILGGRVSDWRKSTENTNSKYSANNYSRSETGVVTPYVGTVYDLTTNWSVYASYTSIFNPQNAQTVSGSYIDPEEGKAYEAGIKGSFFDDKLTTSFAVFKTKMDNLAVLDSGNLTPSGESAYRKEDGTKTKGYEFEIAGELLTNWQIMGGYTHSITKDKEGKRIKTDSNPADQIKLFTSYRLPNQLNKLTIGGGVIWQSRIFDKSLSPRDPQDIRKKKIKNAQQNDYSILSLMARYDFTDKLSLALNANNLLDKKYTVNTTNYTYGEPRNLTATLSWQY